MMAANRGQPPRRARAPLLQDEVIRRRRPTFVPDLLFGLATILWTMAAVFIAVSFLASDVVSGEAGANLARAFSVMLAISGLLLAIIGILLLRDERTRADHFTVPVVVGFVAGALASALFLAERADLVWAPFTLLAFTLRPVRSLAARPFRRSPQ